MNADAAVPYPGQSLGLPETGAGSLASWRARIAALLVDWAASTIVAIGLFGTDVMVGSGWKSWMTLLVYATQKAILTALLGGSFGQLLARVGVVRLDGHPLGWPRAIARAVLVALVIPAVVVGAERRGLDDLLLGTVVVNRR